ncbi:GNAT family N-acetyltransferase [Thalassolituus sp. LLYu03]|uniref:GNAT family N-acetyltransferase n=1 Tax=Thalassolituus sp. LLYu03 TaxID=3421656 RepID=UPI003D26D6E4
MQFHIVTDHQLIPALTTLINRAYRGNDGPGRWTTEQHLVAGDRIQPEAVAAMLDDPQCDVIAAFSEAGGPLQGCISVRYLSGNLAQVAEIGSFAIQPEAHGQGLGSQLLAFAEQHAASQKPVLQVEVVNENRPLKAFYERRGYVANGERMDYPLAANVGLPKTQGLHLVVLRKSSSA